MGPYFYRSPAAFMNVALSVAIIRMHECGLIRALFLNTAKKRTANQELILQVICPLHSDTNCLQSCNRM